jgi:hypothetical protein
VKGPAKKADRIAELAEKVRAGTYRVDSWNLAQLLLVHPEARDALGLPPMITSASRDDFKKKAS